MRRELSPVFRVKLASDEEQIKGLIDDLDVHGVQRLVIMSDGPVIAAYHLPVVEWSGR